MTIAASNARIHVLLALSGAFFYLASHSAAAADFNCSSWDGSDVISCEDASIARSTMMGTLSFNKFINCFMMRGAGFSPRQLDLSPSSVSCRARFLSDLAAAFEDYQTANRLAESMSRRVPGIPSEPTTYGPREMATRKKHGGKMASLWLMALMGLICFVFVPFVLSCVPRKNPRRQSTSTSAIELRLETGPREFRYSELVAATDNFAEERKIGRGGFGPVYRGFLILSDQDRHVAIKVLSQEQTTVQGRKEFKAEVNIMGRLRHRNIVQLLGWCSRRGRLALVYELVPGGSLDTHLYGPGRHLTWTERYMIALGLGSALRFLHTDCDQCIVHGDIKPANVMLDASRNAKLGDFGLARLVDHGAQPRTTQVVAGTVGYIDPEFVISRRPSVESDVYSFGIVLLEIACGKRPTSRRTDQASTALLASVRGMYHQNRIIDAVDTRLDDKFDRQQMERLLVTGLWCAHQDPMERPSIAQAMDVLRCGSAQLPVIVEICDPGEVQALEAQAYGDVPVENSAYLSAKTTSLLTTGESEHSQCIIS